MLSPLSTSFRSCTSNGVRSGPVAKELREDLWARFKAASTVINKRHQEHFEKLKAKEQENLDAKTVICEQIEAIDFKRVEIV